MTHVEISFFMPTGFTDYWKVPTKDRGLAARSVMAQYPDDYMPYLNYIHTSPTQRNTHAQICEPIE